jgi:phenylpropionate dioxygenase-like ring-hydroxylating dioxygenase large terminal subunit
MVDIKEAATEAPVSNGNNGKRQTKTTAANDVRALAAPLGLREYWYPAIQSKKIPKNKPAGLKMLGDQIVFFRGKDGEIKALWNVCPHRGGSLMHGDCHFDGTVSCPYHGWTFDGDGNVLAVLPEGPESKIPGKVKAKSYPTVTLKGMVFIWMGEGEAVPPEEDIPPEFFDDRSMILYSQEYWYMNWQLSLENGHDAHVPYVHLNAARSWMFPLSSTGPIGTRSKIIAKRTVRPLKTGPVSGTKIKQTREYFPEIDGHWPKHNYRKLWSWLFVPFRNKTAKRPPWDVVDEWSNGHRLPSMFRSDHRTDMLTRNSVPVTENESRQIWFKTVRPNSWVGRWYERIHYALYGNWMQVSNFNKQDLRAMGPQRYDVPEYLSSTDSHQILWRRLILQARGMMSEEEALKVADTEAEVGSFKSQENQGVEPERIQTMLKQS